MLRLPNFENAYIDLVKLTEYCLNELHPIGKQKALVFKSALGINSSDATLLNQEILKELINCECQEREEDAFGRRFSVTMNIRIFTKTAKVITSWIIKTGEDFPRLTSCYIKRKR